MLEKDSALIYCWRCGERIRHDPEGLNTVADSPHNPAIENHFVPAQSSGTGVGDAAPGELSVPKTFFWTILKLTVSLQMIRVQFKGEGNQGYVRMVASPPQPKNLLIHKGFRFHDREPFFFDCS